MVKTTFSNVFVQLSEDNECYNKKEKIKKVSNVLACNFSLKLMFVFLSHTIASFSKTFS